MINLDNTGERLLTENYDKYSVEHLHRYAMAMTMCTDLDVLDIASGEGYGSSLLSSVAHMVYGVDISQDAVKHANAKYAKQNLKYLTGSAARIPLPDNSVDRVISFETLEHHDLHEEMFVEIKRVLRQNGLLIMSTPDKLNYTDIPNRINEFHVKELYLEEFRALGRRHFKNLTILLQEIGYFGLITPEAEGSTKFDYFEGDFSHTIKRSAIPKPVYNICVASDVDLPNLSCSVYNGQRALDLTLNQLEAKISDLQKIADGARAQIADLTASTSYKVGRAITYPYRTLRKTIASG